MIDRRSWEQAVIALRQDPLQRQLVRDCYYDDPLSEAAERFRTGEEWKEVQRLLRGRIPARVLDVGAGRGIASYAFCRDGCHVTALEPDPSAIVGSCAIRNLCAEAGVRIDIVEDGADRIPLHAGSVDIVYCRAVLHHLRDLQAFFAEARRVLVRGGLFLCTREHVISRREDLPVFLDSHPLHRVYGGENALLLREYVAAIASAGLKVARILGPFESPINRFPMSTSLFERRTVESVSRLLPPPLARRLGRMKWVQRGYGRFLGQRSQIPGRLYSFMGVKTNE